VELRNIASHDAFISRRQISEESSMLDDRNDINRELGYREGVRDEMVAREDGMSWAPLAVLALFLVIGGFLWFNTGTGDNPRTAANNPAVERSTPAPTPPPAAVKPAPQTIAPATPPASPPQ
jgi:hypothetical protein